MQLTTKACTLNTPIDMESRMQPYTNVRQYLASDILVKLRLAEPLPP